jgi:hypothetical protein
MLLSQLGENPLGDLPRDFCPFGLRDIGIEEYVSILPVHGQGVDVNYLLLVDKVLQNPSQALEEATVDHDDPIGILYPERHRRMGDQERFRITTAGIRLFLGHDVCGKPGNLSPYARPFAGEDRDFFFGDILLRVHFARRADPFHAVDIEGKSRRRLT